MKTEVLKPLARIQRAEVDFLNRMVNEAQDAAFGRDPEPGAQQKLWYARRDLKERVHQLREVGYRV